MKICVGWRIPTIVKIELKLQVTPTPGFNSLYDWCFQMMWPCSGVSEDAQNDDVMEKDDTNAQYSGVKSLMNAIRTEDNDS